MLIALDKEVEIRCKDVWREDALEVDGANLQN